MQPDQTLPDDFQHLVDYLSGESTPEEASSTECWIAEHPERQQLIASFTKARGAFGKEQYAGTVDARRIAQGAIDTIRAQRPVAGAVSAPVLLPITRRTSMRRWYTAGTAALVACVLCLFVWQGWAGSNAASSKSSGVSSYATGNGQRGTITLPDGSVFQLNVGSRLEVPTDYDRGNRTVRISGEAMMTIAHRSDAPFTVVTGQTVTRVLGTTFTVRHYATDPGTTVAVSDGKVVVQLASQSANQSASQVTILTAGQQVMADTAGLGAVRPATTSQFSFANGMLILDNEPLRTAIPRLERWYDATIKLGDPSLASRLVVGDFRTGSLTDLIAILEWTFKLRVVREGQMLTLYPK